MNNYNRIQKAIGLSQFVPDIHNYILFCIQSFQNGYTAKALQEYFNL